MYTSAATRGLNNAASTLEELAMLQERVAVLEGTLLTPEPEPEPTEVPELWTNVYKDGSIDGRVFPSKASAESWQFTMFPAKAVRVRVDEDGNLKPVCEPEPKQEPQEEDRWANVYPDGSMSRLYSSLEGAQRKALHSFYRCKTVKVSGKGAEHV